MGKLKSYFESIGFEGDTLHEILKAFSFKVFKKDFVVEYGKISKHIGFEEITIFRRSFPLKQSLNLLASS